jgi:hypothetical protein
LELAWFLQPLSLSRENPVFQSLLIYIFYLYRYVEVARELSFSFGPGMLDMIMLCDKLKVIKVGLKPKEVTVTRPPAARASVDPERGAGAGGAVVLGGAGAGGAGGAGAAEEVEDDRMQVDGTTAGDDNDNDNAGAAGAGPSGGAPALPAASLQVAPFVPHFGGGMLMGDDNEEDDEVSSVVESLWWRRSVDLATEAVGRYRVSVDTISRGLNWAVGSLIPAAIAGVPAGAAGGAAAGGGAAGAGGAGGAEAVDPAVRNNPAPVNRRREREAEKKRRAAKRAKLQHVKENGGRNGQAGGARGAGAAVGGAGGGAGGSGRGQPECNAAAKGIPALRKVQPGDHVQYRHDELYSTHQDGLSHIIQWVKPAKPVRETRKGANANTNGHANAAGAPGAVGGGGRGGVENTEALALMDTDSKNKSPVTAQQTRRQLQEQQQKQQQQQQEQKQKAESRMLQLRTEEKAKARARKKANANGHWLVPVTFPNAMPPAVHLALVPATPTPSPEEIAGTPEERAEAARRAMLGLPPDRPLTGPRAYATAVERAAAAGRAPFNPKLLEDRVVVEITPPVVYNELHAVVPVIASVSPGGAVQVESSLSVA